MIMSRLNRKRGRKSNYVHSLNSERWTELKRKVRARDGGICRIFVV